jgi:hypothetical protein
MGKSVAVFLFNSKVMKIGAVELVFSPTKPEIV